MSSSLSGQSVKMDETRKNSVGVYFGWYRAGLLDKTLSPLLFTGNGAGYMLVYNRLSDRSLNRIELQFISVPFYPEDKSIPDKFEYISHNVTERYDAYPWASINATIAYEHLRKVKLASQKWSLFMGGSLYNYIQVIYPGTWILSYSLGPKGTLYYRINKKHSVGTSFQFPLVAMVERPPYATWDNDVIYGSIISHFYEGKLMLPNDFFYSKIKLEYRYFLSERWNLLVNYQFNYYNCRKNRKYTSITNELTVGLNYNF